MNFRKEIMRKKVTQRVLVLCEGKTEQLYLSGLKNSLPREIQRDINIQVVQAKESEPKKSLNEAIRKRKEAQAEQQPFKDIWMVFDDDCRDLKAIFAVMEKQNIKPAYTSISIEYRFVLHHDKIHKEFKTADETMRHLKTFVPGYTKTNAALWQIFESNYKSALQNALWLRKQLGYEKNVYRAFKHKPFTNIDELTESLRYYGLNNNI